MAGFINHIASSFAGVLQADKARGAERKRAQESRPRYAEIQDEYEATKQAQALGESDTAQDPAKSTTEQAKEDRQEHAGFQTPHFDDDDGPRLDLSV